MSIQFHPMVSWPFFTGIVLLFLAFGIIPLLIQSKKGISKNRLIVKLLAFLSFLIFLSMAILRPTLPWVDEGEKLLVYDSSLGIQEVDFWKDSLSVKKAIPIGEFEGEANEIVLLGESFLLEELYPLRKSSIRWILPERNGLISDIIWNGGIRKGEKQRLGFRVFSEKADSELKISGIEDSTRVLKSGWNSDVWEFSVNGLGRSELPLLLDSDTLGMIRFFILPDQPKEYFFQSAFPNPEQRTLFQWLSEKGEKVSELTQISRESLIQGGQGKDSAQVLILDPTQINQNWVTEALSKENTSLMIWNISDPFQTISQVNRRFGTNFQVIQKGTNPVRILSNGAEAFPLEFVEKEGQKLLLEGAVAVQYFQGNPLAISLIQSSFPLFRSGEVLKYEKIWTDLITALEPEEQVYWKLKAPILSGFEEEITYFNKDSLPDFLSLNGDSIFLRKNPINPYLGKGQIHALETGWIDFGNDFSYFNYSFKDFPANATAKMLHDFHESFSKEDKGKVNSWKEISPWIWLIGLILSLGVLWIEPKLSL